MLEKIVIIIPVREISKYLVKSIPILLEKTANSIGILVLTDREEEMPVSWDKTRIRLISTGPVGPGEKRDVGVRACDASIVAFLDDDAYPADDWLTYALPHFRDLSVAGVGGPNVTPPSDSFWQQVSGLVYSTWAGAGSARIRYVQSGAARRVDDWPSVNLIVRRSDFIKAGGFATNYFPGEDTKLCLALTKGIGKRIIYEPTAVVFHHRRTLFWGHFKQLGNYARTRGGFSLLLPATSRRLVYMIPSVLVVGTGVALVLGTCIHPLRPVALVAVFGNLLILAVAGLESLFVSRGIVLSLAASLAVLCSHWWYGIQFLRGALEVLLMPLSRNTKV